MKTIAAYNIKGGVGKTATAVNLAWVVANHGARTLVWDLDPQGAASFYFRVKPKVKGGGKGLIRKKRDLSSRIKGTDFEHLDLLPADFSYRNMDLFLDGDKQSTGRLARIIRPLAKEYDYLIIDCPPSISLVSENVFQAADALLVPTIPTVLSLRTLGQLLDFCGRGGQQGLKLFPFFSMVDRRKSLHRAIVDAPPAGRVDFLATHIAYSSEVERMGTRRAPLGSYSPGSHPARCYEALWAEIRDRI